MRRNSEASSSRAKGKRLATTTTVEPEARRKGFFDQRLYNSVEAYKLYITKFKNKQVIHGRNVNLELVAELGLADLLNSVGWFPIITLVEPVYPTLVRAFYANAEVYPGSFIDCKLRGIDIRLDKDKICEILGVSSDGFIVDYSKKWPSIPGFVPKEAIQRLCDIPVAYKITKINALSLSVKSRLLHHFITYSFLPQGGHRSEVSYLEAFLIDSILVGRKVHIGHLMLNQMVNAWTNPHVVLPYGRFMTKVFKYYGINLLAENDMELPSSFDTYDEASMGRLRFIKSPNGEWSRRVCTQQQEVNESDDDMPEAEIPGEVDAPAGSDVTSRIDILETLVEARFSSLETRFSSLETRLDGVHDLLQENNTQQRELITLLRTMHPPRPSND